MKTLFRFAFAAVAAIGIYCAAFVAPARAQFADQATWAGTAGGTANAVTLAIPNWTSNRPGVVLRFLPSADNTDTTTVIVNSVGSPVTIQKPGNNGLANLSGGELRSAQPAVIMFTDSTHAVLLDQLGKFTQANTLSNSALSFDAATNLSLVASVSTNALTIAVKTAAGADPTATTPTIIPFRDSTISNGGPKPVALTGALSFTIASGNTMGCTSGQMCRLWIMAICSTGLSCTNSAGTDVVGLCAYNALSGSLAAGWNVTPIAEQALQTSASGTTGGSLAATIYCNISSVTARAVRILGFVEIQEVTAGTWATGPTYTQLMAPGIKRPGDIARGPIIGTTQTAVVGTGSFIATNITASITPTSAANIVTIQVSGNARASSAGANLQIRRGTSTNVGQPSGWSNSSGLYTPGISLYANDAPNATTSTTYTLYFSGGNSGASIPDVTSGDTIILHEIMSLLEPANDNVVLARRSVA